MMASSVFLGMGIVVVFAVFATRQMEQHQAIAFSSLKNTVRILSTRLHVQNEYSVLFFLLTQTSLTS